ncbi:MAG TPA: polysaccharide biosynthesis protein, partial [Thermomicrobiales bacterium]|nr:polysaccharide biosynthesis protein [Thermomicrobiales bacterium]
PGDVFVQKSSAATIMVLAEAVKRVFKVDNPIRVIGTRHGEKLYETLVTREEMAVAEDMGEYYRVPADNRDLNYGLFFDRGRSDVSAKTDYTSHNTNLLSVSETSEMLRSLDIVKRALAGERIDQ